MLMLSANNLLRPQDGKPVTVPTQDMILGAYYLTYTRLGKAEKGAETVFVTDPGDTDFPVNEIVDADEFVAANKAAKTAGKAIAKFRPIHNYSSVNEAIAAYAAGTVGLHAPIRVRYGKKIDGEMRYRIIDATVGRLIYNEPIPQDLGFVDRTVPGHEFDLEVSFLVGKKQLGKIIDKCIRSHGFTIATEMLDRIKALGYKYSTKGAISVSIADMVVPSVKYEMVHSGGEEGRGDRALLPSGLYHQRRALPSGGSAVGKDHSGRHQRPAGQPGRVQPHLHDGRLRRPWFHGTDPSAGRYARPDGRYRTAVPSKFPSRRTSVKACPFWNTSSPPEAPVRA